MECRYKSRQQTIISNKHYDVITKAIKNSKHVCMRARLALGTSNIYHYLHIYRPLHTICTIRLLGPNFNTACVFIYVFIYWFIYIANYTGCWGWMCRLIFRLTMYTIYVTLYQHQLYQRIRDFLTMRYINSLLLTYLLSTDHKQCQWFFKQHFGCVIFSTVPFTSTSINGTVLVWDIDKISAVTGCQSTGNWNW